jgi:hypothetical protein
MAKPFEPSNASDTKFSLSMIEEWTELPLWRRHCYFYLCLLLLVPASRGVIDVMAAHVASPTKLQARTTQSPDQRIGATDLSDWVGANAR